MSTVINPVLPDQNVPLLEPYENRRPFDYVNPTCAELAPFLSDKWVIGRATKRLREKYPDLNIVSPARFKEAEREAIEARGYARPAEKVILDLLNIVKYHWPVQAGTFETAPEVIAAREVLAKANPMILDLDDNDVSIIAFLLERAWHKAGAANKEAQAEGGYFLDSFASSETRARDRLMRFQGACLKARLAIPRPEYTP